MVKFFTSDQESIATKLYDFRIDGVVVHIPGDNLKEKFITYLHSELVEDFRKHTKILAEAYNSVVSAILTNEIDKETLKIAVDRYNNIRESNSELIKCIVEVANGNVSEELKNGGLLERLKRVVW